ncbi:OB-fold-containig protein [Pseudaestuariivita rosea]|uniref:OB-fold-containig protein n=1 Tax=Pseudaestuariivita rosea TaxID=2763263 RepID=UPI001ABAD59A|nr:OB-fold-containig protein [Pseudaestuariivita rosea]
MFDLLLTGPMVPFTIALALLMGLLTLELFFALLGGTLLGLGAEPELELDIPEFDAPDLSGVDLDGVELDMVELDGPELDVEAADVAPAAGPLAWLGLGKVPVIIWIAAFLLGFGVTGVAAQSVTLQSLGFALPAGLVAIPAAVAGAWFARSFGRVLARLVPKTETTALSERSLGRRIGTVTQGTARRGSLAEVRVIDRYGNFHYLRAEPLSDDDEIPQGTEVLVLRHKLGDGYRLVRLT